MTDKPVPSACETQVLSVLWSKGPLTARQVMELLPDRKARAYTTVLSTMQVMEKKGLIKRQPHGPNPVVPIVFAAAVTQRKALGPVVRDLVRNAFGGRPSQVLQHLLDESSVDDAEMAEIRRIIDEHASKPEKPKGAGRKGR